VGVSSHQLFPIMWCALYVQECAHLLLS